MQVYNWTECAIYWQGEWKCKFMSRKNALRHAKKCQNRRGSIQGELADFSLILAHIGTNLARNNIILYCSRLKFPSTWADTKYDELWNKLVTLGRCDRVGELTSWFWLVNLSFKISLQFWHTTASPPIWHSTASCSSEGVDSMMLRILCHHNFQTNKSLKLSL